MFRKLLKWNARQWGLIAVSEYDTVYKWYEEKRDMCEDLYARLKKRDEFITKLADDLQEANDTIEKMAIEIDALERALQQYQLGKVKTLTIERRGKAKPKGVLK